MSEQRPTVEPGERWQIAPGQQSALIVHAPSPGTQLGSPPPGGGKQRSAPLSSGTQGALSQQSAADAQVSLAALHSPTPRQRGTPSPSSLHIMNLGVSEPQQSERADELEQV